MREKRKGGRGSVQDALPCLEVGATMEMHTVCKTDIYLVAPVGNRNDETASARFEQFANIILSSSLITARCSNTPSGSRGIAGILRLR